MTTANRTTMTDAELRATREQLGLTLRDLSAITGIDEEVLTSSEHGNRPVSPELKEKLNQILEVTEDYISRLITESRARGYILAFRFNAEMSAHVPEYANFGSGWSRYCAYQAQLETGQEIRYPPRAPRITV